MKGKTIYSTDRGRTNRPDLYAWQEHEASRIRAEQRKGDDWRFGEVPEYSDLVSIEWGQRLARGEPIISRDMHNQPVAYVPCEWERLALLSAYQRHRARNWDMPCADWIGVSEDEWMRRYLTWGEANVNSNAETTATAAAD